MNILTIGPNWGLPTDEIIRLGVYEILKFTYPEADIKHAILNNDSANSPIDFYPDEKFDVIIQCGTPFIWDRMELSYKWKNLLLARGVHPMSKFVLMGIGSCYYSDVIPTYLPNEVADFFSRCSVIVRDRLASNVLSAMDVSHHFLPCPGFLAPVPKANHAGVAMVWYDPRVGISNGDWQCEDKFNDYLGGHYDLRIRCDDISYYAITGEEVKSCEDLFGETPSVLRTSGDIFELIKTHKYIYTGRVHIAVPAHVAGCDIELETIDSRARTLFDWIGGFDKNRALNIYRNILCEN